MKYKIVSLILIIPLVLMFCVFSAAKVATLKIPIPVNNVTIFHESEEVINLAEGNEFQINAQVLPRNAYNKGLIYSYEAVNNKKLPHLTIDENGLVKANSYGTAKITVTTRDGAYKKSFLLEVTSTLASDIELYLDTTTDIVVGDEFNIIANVIPDESLDKNIIFTSSDNNIVRINEFTGNCFAISSGKVTLKATLENGINGRVEKELEVIVLPSASSSLITFNGKQNLSDKIFANDFNALMEVNFKNIYELGKTLNISDIILDYDKSKVQNVTLNQIENNNGIYKFNLAIQGLNSDNFNLKAKLDLESYSDFYSEITLEKVVDLSDITLNLDNFKNYIKKNSMLLFNIEILPQDFVGYEINAYFTNDNIELWKLSENSYQMKGLEIGKNTLNIEILYEDDIVKTFTQDIEVLNPPTSLNFKANTENYGIENLLTIADSQILNKEYVEKKHSFEFTSSINLDYIEFKSSDESVAKFIDNELVILNEGKITITATELQAKLLGSALTTSLDIRCVKGVEVGTYEDLVKATEDNKQIVIINDIMLGKQLYEIKSDGTIKDLVKRSEWNNILKSEVKQIETTSEWNYYKYNQEYNAQTPPLINYIIKFTNNCYGNGYVINANNITNIIDSSLSLLEPAVFKGPLNLVALPGASVKAQDNICFITSDNVMLNNVELVGANMRGLDNNDLNQLNYVGTVLEIMGDNVKIVNSRIRNGRNCVRVYGKESGNFEKINVLIESCVISNAREFLVKMGTNAKLYGEFTQKDSINLANGVSDKTWQECSPQIEGFRHLNDGSLSQNEYNELVSQYKESQEFQALVKTNLTIKNCVLHTSGLFSIGLESSFAGPALDGGRWNSYNFSEYGWENIAGTSYPTMLNLEGDVKIYDWKNVSYIDSSTLIEGGLFNFDLSNMIENLYKNGDFTDIISIIDGEKYAHGGIVMYGGGKNYALVNTEFLNIEDLNNYSINLDSLNTNLTTLLKYASGKENFRMLMYGKNSQFNYYQQKLDLESGNAYHDLGRYVF